MDLKDLKSIVSARIYPGIGIARVGNSKEAGEKGYFVGPEVLPPIKRDPGFYRDRYGRLKRQAARFRVYGYNKDNQFVGELTAEDAIIKWTVHVANKKAAWYDFDIALDLPEAAGVQSARRNSPIQGKDRQKLIIDPGACRISGKKRRSRALIGKFFDRKVYLGELRTDDMGRLLFLGGLGVSGTPFSDCYPPSTFANNPCWHDDLSDGPVTAQVWIRGRKIDEVESAWVVATPPNYAPDLIANQTMYDVIADTLADRMLPQRQAGDLPSFTKDILPLFRHFEDGQWLNAGFFRQFGWKGLTELTRSDLLEALATAPTPDPNDPRGTIDTFKELRLLIFRNFRDPGAADFQPLKWPPVFGDSYDGNPVSPASPRDGFTITKTLFQPLQQWANGNFIGDYDPSSDSPQSLDEVPPPSQPDTLDRASLGSCLGGPFHPSLEMSWPMRHVSMYKSSFRLRHRPENFPEPDYGPFITPAIALSRDGPLSGSGPGDITRWLGVPWQTDAASCRAGFQGAEFPNDDFLPSFWITRVPNQVLTEESYAIISDSSPTRTHESRIAAFQERADWMRKLKPNDPYVSVITRMVHEFAELGLIERRKLPTPIPGLPDVMYVETLPPGAATPPTQRLFQFNPELREARFKHRRK